MSLSDENRSRAQGLVLQCGRDGRVMAVLRDDFGVVENAAVGWAAEEIFDPMSQEKIRELVDQVRRTGAVCDWNMNLRSETKPRLVQVSAATADDAVYIFVVASARETDRLYAELVGVNNDQATALREALKALHLAKRQVQRVESQPAEQGIDFEAFAKLNNELATTQRELSRRNAELERLNKLKNQFVGMAAHDLRNPLSGISGLAKLLVGGVYGPLEDKQAGVVQKIEASSAFMLRMVEDLLDVSAIEAGELHLDIKPSRAEALFERLIFLHQDHATSKNIDLRCSVEDDAAIELDFDLEKMEQVLSNLVSNAIKYSESGHWVEVGASMHDAELRFVVRDSGQGIPADELEELFGAFRKTSVRSTGGEKSTGLGLMIVKRIVEGHGGRIQVESEVGVGSTFSVCIPVAARAAA